jgi:UDP:flavonoid glycosyltransferase YjiC (YdhE family)
VARIVLNTFGSFGDVHPYLAIAIELQQRGHECVLATAEIYRQKVTQEGVGFAQVRPNVGELLDKPELIRKLWDGRKGSIYLLRDYLLPQVEQSFTDLDRACNGADLLLTHAAGYAGPVVAAVRKIPWLSVALQPAIFFSKYDPAVVAGMPWARHLYSLGNWVYGSMLLMARMETRRWAKPVFELRQRLGVANNSNPVMEGAFSPFGTLTLFSEQFAQAQRDWPGDSMPTGFVFYDKRGEGFGLPAEHAGGMSDALRQFLADGSAPVLFTLGSSAVTHPGTFYQESLMAAKKLGVRAVMLVGKQAMASSEGVHVEEYASYSALMPLVSAVVHQGGIGTVAQTLRAGKPMLIVPWAHDQPDNGYRLQRMGVGRVLPRGEYMAGRAARELNTVLKGDFTARAEQMAARIRREDGLRAACDRIENLLNR